MENVRIPCAYRARCRGGCRSPSRRACRRADLKPAGIVNNPDTGTVEMTCRFLQDFPDVLPGWSGNAEVLVFMGKIDKGQDPFCRIAYLLRGPPAARFPCFCSDKIEVNEEGGQLVLHIVPDNAREEVEFPVRLPERGLRIFPVGDVAEGKDVAVPRDILQTGW